MVCGRLELANSITSPFHLGAYMTGWVRVAECAGNKGLDPVAPETKGVLRCQ